MGNADVFEGNRAEQEALLDDYFQNWKVFIDTCSLVKPAAAKFFAYARPYIEKYGNPVIIPLRVIDELKKLEQKKSSPEDDEARSLAKEWLEERLPRLQRDNIIVIHGEDVDNLGHADNVFITQFTRHRMKHQILLVTQDKNLAKDIMNLNSMNSVERGKRVEAKRIDGGGNLCIHDDLRGLWQAKKVSSAIHGGDRQRWNKMKSGRKSPTERKNETVADAFCIKAEVTTLPDRPLPIRHVPQENETVYRVQDGRATPMRLGAKVGSGGEGVIYETDEGYVAKIYQKGSLTSLRREKIKRMLSRNISCKGICWPVAELRNEQDEFVGYMMPKAQGKELGRSVFIKQLMQQYFPGWKKIDLVQLCLTILEKIYYLHHRNIIVGDINPANILVVSPQEVYLVDTDSYQIEDFPCPVGTPVYTAPEIQGKPFRQFLRTMGNENFAVATLLFMIMLPGKTPYAQQDGGEISENIKNGNFSYPCGENSNKKTPDGPWRFIWSHLPRKVMKDPLYQTFRKGESHYSEKTRLGTGDWIQKLREYHRLLKEGILQQNDPASGEIYPTSYKKNPNVTYVTCVLCGEEVDEEKTKDGACGKCRSKVYKTVRCKDCGRAFDITEGDRLWFQGQGWDLPVRCQDCREAKRNAEPDFTKTRRTTMRADVKPSKRMDDIFTKSAPRMSSMAQRPKKSSLTSAAPSTNKDTTDDDSGNLGCVGFLLGVAVVIALIKWFL